MKTVFIGIDPGKMGAIASITIGDHPSVILISDMPQLPNGDISGSAIYNTLKFTLHQKEDQALCFVEKAQVMPKQGIKGAFTYGTGYGMILACLQILHIPYQEIPPAKWKKYFSLSNDKGESATKAIELHPGKVSTETFYTPRGRLLDGRAEALLLAEYCRRMSGGIS